MDFGIAKSTDDMHLTRPGTTMGSVYYMSPEQVRGGAVDARSDIYSFGVTLYEMLTGRKPFQAETSYSVLNAQLNEAPSAAHGGGTLHFAAVERHRAARHGQAARSSASRRPKNFAAP